MIWLKPFAYFPYKGWGPVADFTAYGYNGKMKFLIFKKKHPCLLYYSYIPHFLQESAQITLNTIDFKGGKVPWKRFTGKTIHFSGLSGKNY